MPRPPYTKETSVPMPTGGPAVSLLEIDGDTDIADLNISPGYEGRSIPLAPIIEWLATNRPGLIEAAHEAAWRASMTAPNGEPR